MPVYYPTQANITLSQRNQESYFLPESCTTLFDVTRKFQLCACFASYKQSSVPADVNYDAVSYIHAAVALTARCTLWEWDKACLQTANHVLHEGMNGAIIQR
jgi:hypothetical protein